MAVGTSDRRFFSRFVLFGAMFAIAGCQSGGAGLLDVGEKQSPTQADARAQGKILASELRAYCPTVTLREGTAYFNSYASGGQDDQSKLIYQAAIADVTRSCSYGAGTLTLNVAVAGRVVPGPLAKPGPATMPIRVAVTHGEQVLYSQLHQYKVDVTNTSTASQFVFNDPNVTVPAPSSRNYQVFVGFDEGPPKAAPRAPRVAKRVVKKPAPAAQPAPSQTSISDIPR